MSGVVPALTRADLVRASALLARHDRDLARLHARHGPPPMWGRPPGFASLAHIVLEQQVSLASARAMRRRLRESLGRFDAGTLARAGERGLAVLGVTRQKSRYLAAAAVAVRDGALDLGALADLDDAAVETSLTRLDGIGPWTAQVYLVMVLRRPDVWPRGDLALLRALASVKRIRGRLGDDRAHAIAERWRPWRAVAARMLWQHYLAER
ncbi:MAG: DNA-3-methyladenine glycosylase family protein [Candidatus Eisenbacteria bacterium]